MKTQMLKIFVVLMLQSSLALGSESLFENLKFNPQEDFRGAVHNIYDNHNLTVLIAGTLTTIAGRQYDHDMNEYFDHKRRLGDASWIGNDVLGTGVPGALAGIGQWWYGLKSENSKSLHAGQAHLEALVVTGILTAVIKYSAKRQRPDKSDYYSFPSGHTSTVFASATVIQEFYGWRWGVPLYLLGGLTSASRMADGRHWFSDTLAGATLGMVIGHAFAKEHLRPEKISRWKIWPEMNSDRTLIWARLDY